jgi:hypothetical protein
MNNKVSWSFVVIMLLLELIGLHVLYSCVYDYSNIKNVVDAFGFGGTLVGILVGFIAIIYAFYQGAAQQQTNNIMVSELTKLSGIKEDISQTSRALKEDLLGLGSITEKLVAIEAGMGSIQSGVGHVKDALETSMEMITPMKYNPSEKYQGDGDNRELVQQILKSYIARQNGLYLSFMCYFLKDRPKREFVDHGNIVVKILKKHVKLFKENDFDQQLLVPIMNLNVMFLSSLEIVYGESKQEGEDKSSWVVGWHLKDIFRTDIDGIRNFVIENMDGEDGYKDVAFEIFELD